MAETAKASPPRAAPSGRASKRSSALGSPRRAAKTNGSALASLSPAEARQLLKALRELRKGNYAVRIGGFRESVGGRIAAELNALIELNERNARNLSQVAQASRSKSAFLSMTAHELRTPLSVVIGYLSMLQDGSLPPDRWHGALRVLVEKARELNGLVNDLLMAARIEGGTVPTERTVLDLHEVTRQAIGRAEARATLLKAEIIFEETPSAVLVKADRKQLGRIVDNLINNALTYSLGAPWVRISVTDGEEPRLTIQDHGIGIAPENRERVFERFFRVDDPTVGPQPGTGLGLYISRELAERHSGSLVLERSDPGRGCVFVLRLPAPAPAEREAAVLSGPVVTPALEPAASS